MGIYIHGVTADEFVKLLTTQDRGKLKITEVSEPHGRLVDIDEIDELMNHYKYNDFNHIDYYATTVIPSERSEQWI